MRMMLRLAIVSLATWMAGVSPQAALAEVARLDVTARADVAGYPYERVTGRITFSVDPKDSRNAVIVDLDKAPRTPAGGVEFSADFVMLQPKSGGNGVALLDIVNRGRLTAFGFNKPTPDSREVGDGFLLTRGFTIVAVGWEFDAPRAAGLLTLDAPVATDGGKPITGMVHGTATPNARLDAITFTDLAGYTPTDAAAADSVLTVRDAVNGKPTTLSHAQWRLKGNVVTMTGGFEAGRIYELSYRAANPPVAGVGFLAVRDVASWLKHAPDAPAHPSRVYAYGASQSGRFLRDFLYHGCNTDERGRQVLDAAMIHIAGSARLDLNRRWATPVSLGTFSATSFPFADAAQRDPVSGVIEGALDNARARTNQPKVFYTNTGVEYWGGGRAAALVHLTADGSADITPPQNVRIFFLAGAQHTPGRFPPPAPEVTEQRQNPTDYWWTLRALLVALDRWVRDGAEPPASAYPRLADGTLIKADAVAFPAIPHVHSPRGLWGGARIHNALIKRDGAGAALPYLVPQVGDDGNERAGVRLPEVEVPLATYTGWNFRAARVGGTGRLEPLAGSYIPFSSTLRERERTHDPRPSIEERYATPEMYGQRIRASAADLVKRGYVLEQDVPAIVGRALEHWAVATAAASTTTATAR